MDRVSKEQYEGIKEVIRENTDTPAEKWEEYAVGDILDILNLAPPVTPLIEQKWHINHHPKLKGLSIYANECRIAVADTEEMRNLVMGMQKLVKACKKHLKGHPRHADIYDALKDMGVEVG